MNKISLEKVHKLITLYRIFKKDAKSSGICNCDCALECSKLHSEYIKDCPKGNDEDFCNELENFKYKYDTNMLSVTDCNTAPKTLPSVKALDLNFIITTTVTIKLVISFFLFILFKYTALGPRLFPRLRRNKRFKENEVRETQKLGHISERSRSKGRNKSYNIVYNTAAR